jgi:hypothetical protein
MKAFNRASLGMMIGGLGLICLNACQPNPLGLAPVESSTVGVTFAGVSETATTGLIFSPATASASLVGGGIISTSRGGASKVFSGPSSVAFPDGVFGTGSTALIIGSANCPGLNCGTSPKYRGIGGASANFSNDFFVRWAGFKGPSASDDWSSLQFNFPGETDLRGYRGVVFWARGHGNFSVNLAASLAAGGPYTGYNFYLRRFGNELNGDAEWKEIIVYFDQMVQEYGLAANLPTVLSRTTGLQFDQQSPYTANFQLDLDYVRFF